MDTDAASLTDQLLNRLAAYATTDDEAMIGPLRVIYREWVEATSASLRGQVLQRLLEGVEQGQFSTNALLPFVGCETDRGIASTAAISFAMLHPQTADEAMLGVILLSKGLAGGTMTNPGAVFGGLLNLGDWRVNKMLWPIRGLIQGDDLDEAVRVTTGRVSAAVIGFLLDWVEQMSPEEREHQFNPIAAALVNQRAGAMIGLAALGGRVWPVADAEPEAEDEAAEYVHLDDYAASILPRLQGLREIAPEPEVVAYIVDAWRESLAEE